jgi:hypothetical protein
MNALSHFARSNCRGNSLLPMQAAASSGENLLFELTILHGGWLQFPRNAPYPCSSLGAGGAFLRLRQILRVKS